MMSLDVCKIVWKISNLNKSRRLIYKIRNFLTSGFEIYAIWVECLVNKLSQIPDVNSGLIRHIVAQIRKENSPCETLSVAGQ